MITIAFAGCAHIHTPGFIKRLKERTDVAVKFVWDPDPARARLRAEEIGARAIDQPEAIWKDPDVQAVLVLSETFRHEEIVLAAAADKKHLFVEKPLGMGRDDAFRMAGALEKAGVIFMTGYFMRGDPVHQTLKALLAKGSFGRVTRLRISNCHAGSLKGIFDTEWRWMADPAAAGCGAFGDLGTHALDIMLWLLGEDVERVTASVGVATSRYGACDEYGEGLLRFRNGVIGSLAAGWVDMAHPVSLVLSGTEGHAYIVDKKLYLQGAGLTGADGKSAWTDLPPAWHHPIHLFLDAVAGKNAVPLVTAREAAVRSAVMEALYTAAKQNGWVNLATA